MPAKKSKKAVNDDCGCMCHKPSNIESWLLILLGAVGLLMAMGLFSMGQWNTYFQYVWSVLAIVIGMMMLMKGKCGCC